jgi:hypothetical protein
MPHPLLKSREFGATDEAICLNAQKWTPARITAEASNERLERAYFRDGLRKLGILNLFGLVDAGKIQAMGDVLLRWSAFPGTSMYFCGSHAAPQAVYECNVDPKTFDAQEARHTAILEALGPVVWHPGFAYAMDVEAPGKVDPEAKRIMQAELIGRLRKRWPNLTFLCSTRNWSNPQDLIGYKLPADNCIARICFYEPFPFTHWWTKEIGLPEPPPYPLSQSEANRLAKLPGVTEWGKQLLQAAVGFGKPQMEKILRECIATGTPFLISEAGVGKVVANAADAARWHKDLDSVCYKLGVALMKYSWGSTTPGTGTTFGLGIGL